MILCEKKVSFAGFIWERNAGQKRLAQADPFGGGETSSKRHICCFRSRFLSEEHCKMGTKAGPCLKVEIGRWRCVSPRLPPADPIVLPDTLTQGRQARTFNSHTKHTRSFLIHTQNPRKHF